MKTLVLLLILNNPDGSWREIEVARGLSESQCLPMQAAVWNSGSPVAYRDAQGPVPVLDAACVYESQLAKG